MSTNSSSNAGSTAGQKLKGAFQTVHGIGEAIRGNAMDFVDSATGTERKEHGTTLRGRQETETGVANMESHRSTTASPPVEPSTTGFGSVPVQPNTASMAAGSAVGSAGATAAPAGTTSTV